MSGRLVVCPTPIGNLEDVTLRVLAALRAADVVACEDTRHTRKLLDRYGVTGALVSYHEHNERERAAELVARMRKGAVVALVSDAGHAARLRPRLHPRAGLHRRRALGRGAARAELGARRARRVGPARRPLALRRLPAARRKAELERLLLGTPETLVAFESPQAPGRDARRCSPASDPERPVAVCRELTKLHEEVRRGPRRRDRRALRDASRRAARSCSSSPRRRRARSPTPQERALAALRALVDAGARPRPAAKALAELTGVPANRLYRALTDDRAR